MKMMKRTTFAFIFICVVVAVSAQGLLIVPSNINPEPADCNIIMSPGGILSFDLMISNPQGISAQGFQAIISVSGPGSLTGNEPSSIAVANDTNYWIYGNSAGSTFIDNSDGSYTFGDNPDSGLAELLLAGDIMARYAFTWDGTIGDYTFTIDLDTSRSFYLDEFFSKQAFQFSPEECGFEGNSFTLHIIPEPATLLLITFGGLFSVRVRKV